jgi:hypothetical protein
MQCQFEQCEHLGDRDIPELEPFDVITCMFAVHYFFNAEGTLATFLRNVAGSLKDGAWSGSVGRLGDRLSASAAGGGFRRVHAHLPAAFTQPLVPTAFHNCCDDTTALCNRPQAATSWAPSPTASASWRSWRRPRCWTSRC